MKLNDELHRDLFDMFLVERFTYCDITCIRCWEDLELAKECRSYQVAMELLEQSNHPEQYEAYIGHDAMDDIRLIQGTDMWDSMPIAGSSRLGLMQKIKIILEEE